MNQIDFDGPDSEIERLLNDYAGACKQMSETTNLWYVSRKQNGVVDGDLVEMRRGAQAEADARSAVEMFIYNLTQKIG